MRLVPAHNAESVPKGGNESAGVQVVALTKAGEDMFTRLREAAVAFDASLRAGLAGADLATLSDLLGRLADNAAARGAARDEAAAPPWAGLADRREQSSPIWKWARTSSIQRPITP